MEINKLIGELNPYVKKKVGENQSGSSSSRSSRAEQQSSDTVNLSSEAKLRGTALQTATTSPDVRADKVRELKEKVRNGTYQPDIRKAARNLLRDDFELITGKSPEDM